MMKKILLAVVLCGGLGLTSVSAQQAEERLPGYLQAEKFTKSKLDKMLFSTTVDPHWFQQGNNFWFEYKTSEGKFWYVVNPSAKRKELLFDREQIASQLTEIVQDPFEARQLPIAELRREKTDVPLHLKSFQRLIPRFISRTTIRLVSRHT